MTTSIVTYQDSISGAEVELSIAEIKRTLCPKATDQEASNFLRLCQYMGLNPFVNDAYLIKYGDNAATMVVGKDAFTKRADAHPQFAGIESGVIVRQGDAEPIYRKGSLVLTGEAIVGGWGKVARNDRRIDIEETVTFDEFNTNRAMWSKMPATMIQKVAIVKSLRTAFPATFSGMYDQAEMGIDMTQDFSPLNSNVVEGISVDTTTPDIPPDTADETADESAVFIPPTTKDVPYCDEHKVSYEWRINPDTNEGKYVHGYNYEIDGKARTGWCVAP